MRVAVLGTGNMGKAILGGLQRTYGSEVSLLAHDVSAEALAGVPEGVETAPVGSWFTGKDLPDAVVVAVKPDVVSKALNAIPSTARKASEVLWCSVAAGTTLSVLEKTLGSSCKICRVMPNAPALVGEGMSVFALNDRCTERDAETARKIFGACGKVLQAPEKLMDAVTGLSGSGPAYVYLFVEALIEGGVAAGLPYATAREAAIQTVRGAASMMEQTGESPAQLKARVMSPGGTTVRGLAALEERGFKYAVIKAVAEATRRAGELTK